MYSRGTYLEEKIHKATVFVGSYISYLEEVERVSWDRITPIMDVYRDLKVEIEEYKEGKTYLEIATSQRKLEDQLIGYVYHWRISKRNN